MESKVFKAISLLLEYPTDEVKNELGNISNYLINQNSSYKTDVVLFRNYMESHNIYQLEEEYVALFDRGRGNSLYLFEHVHGESKERGQAMLDLIKMYLDSGIDMSSNELPDYLPVFLEYISTLDFNSSINTLKEVEHLLLNIRTSLVKTDSIYAAIFNILLLSLNIDRVQFNISSADTIPDFDKVDKEWIDEPVEFGESCSSLKNGLKSEHVINIHRKNESIEA